jgi:hypothetical protein
MDGPLHELGFRSLAVLDGGKIDAALSKHLQRASVDCQDRPGDNKPRSVTIDITFQPVVEEDGDCLEAKMDVRIKSKVPVHQSKAYSVGLRRGGKFVFNEESLGNVNQNTFGYGDDDQ